MGWLDRLEARFGSLGIPGLGRAVVALQVLLFVVAIGQPDLVGQMVLDPSRVAAGEWWRLATFLCVPSLSPLNVLLAVFYFLFQWSVFGALEAEWGSFRLTLYLLIGWVTAAAPSLLLWHFYGVPALASGGYWSLSVLLAFATFYPDTTIYLYLILPVRMQWAAWAVGAFLVYRSFVGGLAEAATIAVGLLNYLLFFGPALATRGRQASRAFAGRQAFLKAQRSAALAAAPRRCNVCGAGPEADLRLCTCAACGPEGRQWCAEHLAGHRGESAAPAPVGETREAAARPKKATSAEARGPEGRTRRPRARKTPKR